MMKKILASLFCCISLCAAAAAQDIVNGLEPIGPISGSTKTEAGVTFDCQDGSQVRLTVLAPDLVRVRASFRKPLPTTDHSWAIAKTSWETPRWAMAEGPDAFTLSTDELEVVVRRSPLLIEFRDAKTHRTINSDERPMMFDARGTKAQMMFDPQAGPFVSATKRLGFDEHFYGLGEKAARLDKRRGFFTNWNSDTPGYTEGRDPIYQTIPFYIGLERGAAYAIFFDNSYRSYFDFGRSSQQWAAFGAEGGEMNYYFFWGPEIKKILGRYSDLTGHMPMPPLWALGNQQSRWSYYPEAMAEEVVRQYRARDLPLDVLHLDIDYMQAYRVFTFDTQRFPDPKAFTDRMRRQGVRVVTIVDPGVKHQPPAQGAANAPAPSKPELLPQDKSYYVFNQGVEKNYFQRRRNGELYVGKVWPGESVLVDFTLPEARRWWGDLHRAYIENGIAGIWNDMNEPSDFVDQTGKNQLDVVSFDEGERSTHARNRNVFGLLMARATYEGLERLEPDKRPYVITRAAYAGYQRYSTMWTGDTTSTWETLSTSIPMYQSLGLSGQPFVGGDVGGFIGRGNGELLTRAYQISFLVPFCRNHKDISGYDNEPWRFGKYYEDIIRKYLKLRYRLMPFLYTTLEEAHRTGMPLIRPLLLNYQNDESTLNLDDQFMVGRDLLVAPILKPDQTQRLVYLPEGTWFDYWTGKKYTGGTMIRADAPLETVPMYVRGGAIIPMGPEMSYTNEKPVDPLSFMIYADEKGRAEAALYEDDGSSPAYRQGAFRRTRITVSPVNGGFQINTSAPEGTYDPGRRNLQLVFANATSVRQVSLDGKSLGASARTAQGNGWYREGEGLTIRITDDGRAHQIQIR
ncbi:MAG TPA: TIM-barrel domain-containing protein [Pyrinomonadaceae bacterium]|jgi:alpha-glucosidase|nr:TIM-barrel domain-containing protein [Pyrinomonadaceae bacterium]